MNLPSVTQLVIGRTLDLHAGLSDFKALTLITVQTPLAQTWYQASEVLVFPRVSKQQESLLKYHSRLPETR